MVSKKLMGAWALFAFSTLICGIISVVFSVLWRTPNVVENMVVNPTDCISGIVLGVFLLISFAVSIFAVVQPNHVTFGLYILNWLLIVDSLVIIVIGTRIWYFTLMIRNNFQKIFAALSSADKITVQDHFKCCGYFNATDIIEIGGSFCTDPSVSAALDKDTGHCVTPITKFADVTLNNIFTSIYGFMAVIICLFLASLCVIKKRQEAERFKKIDAKRGGRGFV